MNISHTHSEAEIFELGKQRIVVENAFGLLKNRFKRLTHPIVHGEKLHNRRMIMCVFLLHDFLLEND